jgi:hypothetical protein
MAFWNPTRRSGPTWRQFLSAQAHAILTKTASLITNRDSRRRCAGGRGVDELMPGPWASEGRRGPLAGTSSWIAGGRSGHVATLPRTICRRCSGASRRSGGCVSGTMPPLASA